MSAIIPTRGLPTPVGATSNGNPVDMQYPMLHHTPSFVFFAVPVSSHHPPQSPLMSPSNKTFSRRRSSSSLLSSPSNRYREGPSGANLFVKNFPLEWENKDLQCLFEKFGDILSCNIFIDRITGHSKGFGFVSFAHREHANMAIAHLNGFYVGGDDSLIVEPKLKESALHSNNLHRMYFLNNPKRK